MLVVAFLGLTGSDYEIYMVGGNVLSFLPRRRGPRRSPLSGLRGKPEPVGARRRDDSGRARRAHRPGPLSVLTALLPPRALRVMG